jgi:type IV pilus assembly protein PilV
MKNKMNSAKNSNAGFTLLEVLVAVLVLSFGLLGVAGLLLSTVQNNTIAAQRTTATFLAQDMADRIRQNINATKPIDANGNVQPVYYLNSEGLATACYGTSPTGPCATREGVAARDLFLWNAQIKDSQVGLPGGSGIVCKDLNPDDGVSFANNGCDNDEFSPWVIKIFWVVRNEDRSSGAPANVQRLSMMVGGT